MAKAHCCCCVPFAAGNVDSTTIPKPKPLSHRICLSRIPSLPDRIRSKCAYVSGATSSVCTFSAFLLSLSLPLVKLPTFALQSCPVAPSARVSRECRISGWMVRVTSQYDDSPYVLQHARSNEQRSPGSRCARNGTWREPGIGSSRDQINIYSDINICKKQLPLISIHVVVGLAGSERASRQLVCVCPGAHRR